MFKRGSKCATSQLLEAILCLTRPDDMIVFAFSIDDDHNSVYEVVSQSARRSDASGWTTGSEKEDRDDFLIAGCSFFR